MHAPDALGTRDLEQRWKQVNDMDKLVAQFSARRDPGGPADNQWVGDATQMGTLLVHPKWRVRNVCPAHRIVRKCPIFSHLVIELFCQLKRNRPAKTRPEDVGRTSRRPFGRTAVIRNKNNCRVLTDPKFVECCHQPTNVGIDIADQPGVDLHVAGVDLSFARAELVPGVRTKGQRWELGGFRHDAQFTLALQTPGSDHIPTFVVSAFISIPLSGARLQRRMRSGEGNLEKKRFFRSQ